MTIRAILETEMDPASTSVIFAYIIYYSYICSEK